MLYLIIICNKLIEFFSLSLWPGFYRKSWSANSEGHYEDCVGRQCLQFSPSQRILSRHPHCFWKGEFEGSVNDTWNDWCWKKYQAITLLTEMSGYYSSHWNNRLLLLSQKCQAITLITEMLGYYPYYRKSGSYSSYRNVRLLLFS